MVAEAHQTVRGGLVDLASPSAEPFRSLRLALDLRTEVRRGNVILFTSPGAGEGKSMIAANFAMVSSLSQSSVLLIDGDLRRPTLHSLFGLPRTPGLVDYFTKKGSDDLPPKHSVKGLSSLSVITAGRRFERTGDLVSSARMAQLLAIASSRFSLVVVDAPPLLLAVDAASLAAHPNVDVVLIVTQKSRRRATLNALRKLELIGANVIGLISNREGSLSSYGY